MLPEPQTFKSIKIDETHEGKIIRVLLNTPKANVLDMAMMKEIAAFLRSCQTRDDLKLIIFEGAGDHFSFGASVEEHTPDKCADLLRVFHSLFDILIDLKIPTLSKVRGQCLGGALELAGFCNFVFADAEAKFGVPEISLAVFPPPASIFLPLKIGQGRADAMILTGVSMKAQEAEQVGLVTHVSPKGDLNDDVEAFIAKTILPKSANSLRHAVAASRWSFNSQFKEQCQQLEDYFLNELMQEKDAQEGIQAFIDKRQPVWTHG